MARSSSAVKIIRTPMLKPPRGLRLVPTGALAEGGFRGRLHRVRGRARAMALSSKPVTMPLLGAAGYGALRRTGFELPFEIPMIGPAGTVAVALWAVGAVMRMPTLKQLAIGPACIAVAKLAAGHAVEGARRPVEVEGFDWG